MQPTNDYFPWKRLCVQEDQAKAILQLAPGLRWQRRESGFSIIAKIGILTWTARNFLPISADEAYRIVSFCERTHAWYMYQRASADTRDSAVDAIMVQVDTQPLPQVRSK